MRWDPAQLSLVSHAAATPGVDPQVNAGNAARGTLTLAVASAGGFAGRTALLRLTFRAGATSGKAGTLAITVTELFSAGGFADLLPRTTAVTHPMVLR